METVSMSIRSLAVVALARAGRRRRSSSLFGSSSGCRGRWIVTVQSESAVTDVCCFSLIAEDNGILCWVARRDAHLGSESAVTNATKL